MADERLLPSGIADARSRALLEVMDRLDAVDRGVLLTYRIDSVPSAALYALAWQFDVVGLGGWDLAATDAQRRDLLRRAIEFHRRAGTPWVITEALKAVGWPDADVDEHFGAARYDGTFTYDATITYSFGSAWAKFAVIVGEVADDYALSTALATLFRGIIERWKNARSQLVELAFAVPAIADTIPALGEDLMPIDLTTYHRYDGVYRYDSEITYAGFDTITLPGI